MKKHLIRFAFAACVSLYFGALSHAHTLSSNFECGPFGEDIITTNPLKRADQLPVNEQVRQIAERLSTVAGKDGRTIYPAGTVIDRAEIVDGWLEVWVTFPDGVTDHSLDRLLVYQAGGILRHFFADANNLVGSRFHARLAGQQDYQGIDAFVADETAAAKAIGRKNEKIYEPDGPGPQPDPDYDAYYKTIREMEDAASAKNVGGQASPSTSGSPTGALAGRVIFTYGGHGRTWDGSLSTWRWQRGYTNSMMEDFGNADASDAYAYHCFNAGATVVSLRPIGYQNNEVVLDNTNAAVTRTGTWSNSSGGTNGRWYGSGTPAYHYAATANTETATATYTPNIPAAGYYPVYTWANYGDDRVPGGQLYRIRSTGGESLVRIDHRRVGCGWIYLGTYYFNAGSNSATGSVVISNQNPPAVPAGSYVAISDAIRFGNGMGDANNGSGISGYSRREESTVYWCQNGWGNGDTTWANLVWNNSNANDDENQSWQAPPRMAGQMYRVNADTTVADMRYALYLGWHSNAFNGTARGSVGLITSDPTPNQAWWAAKVSDQIDLASDQEDPNWENTWNNRPSSTYTDAYGEITDTYFDHPAADNVGEMDATIIEVAYHDNVDDAELLRDPKVRLVHGRAAYHAAVQYFNNFKAGTLAYLPEPPTRLRVKNNGTGGVTLTWQPGPTGGTKGQAASSYRVYQSPDGLGFGAGIVAAGTNHTVTGLTAGQTYYFRVTGVNAGGESFPTDTLAVRVKASGFSNVLVVNGYDRFDRYNNVPRPSMSPTVEQIIYDRNNSFNYIRQHAAAIANHGLSLDSCDNEAIINGDIALSSYDAVVWIGGEESTADDTFNTQERAAITTFLNTGNKKLFVSGAEIGYELDSTAVDASFYNNFLAADYGGDDGGSYQATGVVGTIFAGIVMDFPVSATMYDVDFPDRLNAFGGSLVAANYSGGGSGGAAVQFNGGSPARKIVNLGFPFEAINSSAVRNQVMSAALTFFGTTDVGSAVGDWQMY